MDSELILYTTEDGVKQIQKVNLEMKCYEKKR